MDLTKKGVLVEVRVVTGITHNRVGFVSKKLSRPGECEGGWLKGRVGL